jgi:hypothetical protein
MFHSAPLPPRSPEIEGILIALDELGEVLDDELNAIWDVLSTRRQWWRRWQQPSRHELVSKAQRQRLMYEKLKRAADDY